MYRNTTADPPRPLTLASGLPLGPGEDGPANPDVDPDRAFIAAGDLAELDLTDEFAEWVAANTVTDVLERVGDDLDLRAQALAAEQAREKPRVSLVDALQAAPTTEETT